MGDRQVGELAYVLACARVKERIKADLGDGWRFEISELLSDTNSREEVEFVLKTYRNLDAIYNSRKRRKDSVQIYRVTWLTRNEDGSYTLTHWRTPLYRVWPEKAFVYDNGYWTYSTMQRFNMFWKEDWYVGRRCLYRREQCLGCGKEHRVRYAVTFPVVIEGDQVITWNEPIYCRPKNRETAQRRYERSLKIWLVCREALNSLPDGEYHIGDGWRLVVSHDWWSKVWVEHGSTKYLRWGADAASLAAVAKALREHLGINEPEDARDIHRRLLVRAM